MKIGAKGHGEDARRLREFTAFDNFSDDELERLVRACAATRAQAHAIITMLSRCEPASTSSSPVSPA
jgi:hypothetical protein